MHPTTKPIPIDSIPAELRQLRQWVLWRSEIDGRRVPLDTDKARKVPYQVNGKKASSTNPQQWNSFENVVRAYKSGKYDGIGCVIQPPYVGIDLDECIDSSGNIADWATHILDTMGSYSEYSPSGKGIKIWVKGEIPDSTKTESIEIYNQARYFTVTGNVCDNSAIRSVNGELTALWQSLQKPTEIPLEVHRKPVQPPIVSDYMQIWIDSVIERGRLIVASAADGNKHNARIRAAKLLGGLVVYGVSEDEIINILYDAQPPSANLSGELKAIRDGIEYGKRNPLVAPKQPPQPEMINGAAYCPKHHTPLPPSKNGNGYKCHAKDESTASGYCDFWWKGDGYVMPQTKNEVTPNATNAIKQLSVTTNLLSRSFLFENEIDSRVKPPTFLVKKYIALGEVTVIYGPSDAGKSTIVVDMACRINQYAKTLYVAGEDASGVKVKRGAWMVHHRRGTNGNFLIRDTALDLSNPEEVHQFITEVHALGLKCIVIDTLSQCSGNADENTGMKPIMEALQKIAHELHVAVIAIHHTGKNGEYRGDSKIRANSYGFIHITQENDLIKMEVDRIKNTGERDHPTRYFRFVTVKSGYVDFEGNDITAPVPEPAHRVTADDRLTKPQIKILELVANMIDGERTNEIQRQSGLSGNAFYVPWKVLRERNYIRKRGDKHTDPFVITDLGRAELAKATEDPNNEQVAVVKDRPDDTFEINEKVTIDQSEVAIDSNSGRFVWHMPENTTSYRDAIGYDEANTPQQEAQSSEMLPLLSSYSHDSNSDRTDTTILTESIDSVESIVSSAGSENTQQPTYELNRDYLRERLAAKDWAGFVRHCHIHRVNPEQMLAEIDPDDN